MKYLYVSNKKIKGLTNPSNGIIDYFYYKDVKLNYTGFGGIVSGMDFTLKSYHLNYIIANINYKELDTFLNWVETLMPQLPLHINIYGRVDKQEALYQIETDRKLTRVVTFNNNVLDLFSVLITPMTD